MTQTVSVSQLSIADPFYALVRNDLRQSKEFFEVDLMCCATLKPTYNSLEQKIIPSSVDSSTNERRKNVSEF